MAEAKETILIVEDDIDVVEMLTAYFHAQGYTVLEATCGEDAVKICRANRPDLVILDIRLPDFDGFEVAKQLRSHTRTSDIPIIFLTEKRARADRLKGLEVGADDYLTKPFDIQELRLRVRNALRRTTQSSLTNTITGLPEGVLVDERLEECLDSSNWAILLVSIANLVNFREAYGFVASDDVKRAVGLMVHNALRDIGSSSDFIGQYNPTVFILIIDPSKLTALAERIRSRMEQSLDYFYPLKDQGMQIASGKRLGIQLVHVLDSEGPFASLEDLKAELARRNG